MGKVNEHVVVFVPFPVPVICWLSPPWPLHCGAVPDGAVMVHCTLPVGFGSLGLAGLAPTVAMNDSVDPGWAGEGDELEVRTVVESDAMTLMLVFPAPGP